MKIQRNTVLDDLQNLSKSQINFLEWWYNSGAEIIRMGVNNTGDDIMIFIDGQGNRIGYVHERSFRILFEQEYDEYKLSELLKEYE